MSPKRPSKLVRPDAVHVQLGQGSRRGEREDILLDGQLVVHSRDGLTAQERCVATVLPKGRKGRVLVVNARSIVPAVAMRLLNPEMSVVLHHEDHWPHARALHDISELPPELVPELHLGPEPPEGPFEAVVLPLARLGVSDVLRESIRLAAARWLAPDGLLYAGFEGTSDAFVRGELNKAFPAVTIKPIARLGVGYVARRPAKPLVNLADTEAKFTVREGERVLEFRARPGVFCHDRLDDGTRALLAVAEVLPSDRRILDLGCGCGVVAVVAAGRAPDATIVALDSSARAIAATQGNVQRHGLEGRVETILHSDPPQALSGVEPFDLVLSNPPYYGNWRIAESFLEGARLALRPGGRLILVTKAPNWFRENMPADLVVTGTALRGGYSIIEARKSRG